MTVTLDYSQKFLCEEALDTSRESQFLYTSIVYIIEHGKKSGDTFSSR